MFSFLAACNYIAHDYDTTFLINKFVHKASRLCMPHYTRYIKTNNETINEMRATH